MTPPALPFPDRQSRTFPVAIEERDCHNSRRPGERRPYKGGLRVICRVVILLFALAYGAAFALAIGFFQWFGYHRDSLDAIFLILLGLPWSELPAPPGSILDSIRVGGSPAVNLTILFLLCRFLRARKSGASRG
jgi:hypothetical protein